jgi:hypothetical protein
MKITTRIEKAQKKAKVNFISMMLTLSAGMYICHVTDNWVVFWIVFFLQWFDNSSKRFEESLNKKTAQQKLYLASQAALANDALSKVVDKMEKQAKQIKDIQDAYNLNN